MLETHSDRFMREDLDDFADRASDFLKILSGRTRTLLLWHLFEGEKSVSELAKTSNSSITSTSQQLSVLRTTGLVTKRRNGQKVFYSLADENARKILCAVRDMHHTSDSLVTSTILLRDQPAVGAAEAS